MLVQKLKDALKRVKERAGKARAQRQQVIANVAWYQLTRIRTVLFLVGYTWLLLLPLLELGQKIYIDENALQPGQVNTYWNWAEVHRADAYLDSLERLRDTNATSKERSAFLRNEFAKLGIPTSTQDYAFNTSSGVMSGSNAYGMLSSPRSSGAEAIVISASWISRIDEGAGTLNLRGVATVLALASYLKEYSLWSKDLAFVISDGYLDGMQAWINAYHGHQQNNLDADPLEITSGTIWTALNIDYPGHSFSHLGIFFEGLNGRLPNQDLLNSFHIVSRHTGGVPVVLYDHIDPHDNPSMAHELVYIPSWLPAFLKNDWRVRDYAYRAKNLLRHFRYQSRGKPSGVHGLLHQFRIDAITLFAVPATGPHGFHAIGRIVESTLRTTNNLLERLHASFFFYLLPTPSAFMKIGFYLPSVVLIGTSMIFGGLGIWVHTGWVEVPASNKVTGLGPKWGRRARPAIRAISIMVVTHLSGVCLFLVLASETYLINQTVMLSVTAAITSSIPVLISLFESGRTAEETATTASLLKAFNLCLASTVISITSVLNFSLAALLAILMGIPLSLSRPSKDRTYRNAQHAFYTMLGIYWLLDQNSLAGAVWDWEVLGVWFAPFMSTVYFPLLLQAATVAHLTHSES